MSRLKGKGCLVVVLLGVVACLINQLVVIMLVSLDTAEQSFTLVDWLAIAVPFLTPIVVLSLGIVVKSREERGYIVQRSKRLVRTLLRIVVVLYILLPTAGFVVLFVLISSQSPKTEGTSGLAIYGGVPIPIRIPGGIPLSLVAALIFGGLGYAVARFAFDKIKETFD